MFALALTVALAAVSPFDDLSREEIATVVSAIKADKQFGSDARFPIVMTREPAKALVLAARNGGPAPKREGFAAVYEPSRNRFTEVTVDIAARKISMVRELAGVQPPILLDEYADVSVLVHADPRWQEAMKKRGITDFASVYVDGWVPGLLSASERAGGKRLMRALSYLQEKGVNFYSRPIEGVMATIDLNERKVIEVIDSGPVPIVERIEELFPGRAQREAVKPIKVTYPKGMSFSVEGQRIQWQGWSLRYSIQPHKGLVIYDVSYTQPGSAPRPILYKGALSEMVVPYGDPGHQWSFRNAFDVGEYGLGRTAHTLDPLVDTPEGARFFDGVFTTDDGKPLVIPRAVAVYERDAGLLWKHVDQNTRTGQARRARELVVTFTTTIGNYDYGVDWIFTLDGVIEVEAYLTGILLAQGSALTENACTAECKRLVAKQIIAPNHQHFFSFRLDMDVDGAEGNTPVEMNVVPMTGATNPDFNAFEAKLTPLVRESGRDLAPASARKWKVTSTKTNALGHPTGYMLMGAENATAYLGADSQIRARARFVEHPVWFTRYKDEEQSSAGDYPNQSSGGDGLPKFIADNESTENTDVVLWYTFGITHIPRPEEWPIMNAHRAGFKLMPFNFFAQNPALTVPPVPAADVKKALK